MRQLKVAWPAGVEGNSEYSRYYPDEPGFSPQSIIPLTSFVADYAEADDGGVGFFGAWGSGEPIADAIVGSSVKLTVVDANGLTDSVTEQLPFREATVDLTKGDVPSCYSLADVTEPPSVALSTVALRGNQTVVVPLTCSAPILCDGTVTLSELLGKAADANAAAVQRRPVTIVVLGRAGAAVGHGEHGVIYIKLSRLGRALARRGRLHSLRVTVRSPRHGRHRAKMVSRVVRVRRAHRR